MAISKVTELKQAIKKLSTWETTDNAFGYIKKEGGRKLSYIYEFYCAMRILKDLSKNHSIVFIPGKGATQFCFPKAPSKKANYASFLLHDGKGNPLFQVTLGTEISISSSPKTTYAADISFQLHNAPDDPDETHVVLIFDSKYKTKNSTTLDISIIREFAKCVQDMATPKSVKSKLVFDKLTDLNANCLITNGMTADDHEQYCKNHKLVQVGEFNWDRKKYNIIG